MSNLPADSLHRKDRKGTLYTIKCSNCGTDFQTYTKTTGLCSRKCVGAYLSKQKNKDVELICKLCLQPFIVPYNKRKRVCCSLLCTSKYANKIRDPIAAGLAVSLSLKKGFANGSIQKTFLGKKHTEATKQLIREKAIKRIPKKTKYKTGMYFSSKLNRELLFRSSWEQKFFKCIDNDINVLVYDTECIPIDYFYMQKRVYYPDLLITYIDGLRKLIEIKPTRYINKLKNKAKFDAAQKYSNSHGISFEVWTELSNPYLTKTQLFSAI